MTDQTIPDSQLDLRAELARIDRDRAETNKLLEEATKLTAERHKLMREGEKYRRPLTLSEEIRAHAEQARADLARRAS